MKKTKFIFITGGVLSSLGKGLAGASIGALLKARGLSVTIQKLDPYINVDPGNMNPLQHGEVFVTDDGAETDLDLGHYERFLNIPLTQKNNYTSGSIYYSVINKERRGEYNGRTVQVIPHVTDEIKLSILGLQNLETDIAIIEIGGTVGDIESLPFLEAIRQLRSELGREHCLFIHLTLVPYLAAAGEHKTKPTQHSVKELRSIGIQPDIILCRCDVALPNELKRKIALFCDVDVDAVFTSVDVDNIYKVPLAFYEEGIDQKAVILLRLPAKNPDLTAWKELTESLGKLKGSVNIGIVGKYVELREAYKSLHEALVHGGIANKTEIEFSYINSEEITAKTAQERLGKLDGILVPGGFGERGVEGKIHAVQFAREQKIPFFGISLGMQCAVIDFARNVANLSKANSEEFDSACKDKVIYLMPGQHEQPQCVDPVTFTTADKRGFMRLGSCPCVLLEGTYAYKAYGEKTINERHRHRYEVNNAYLDKLTSAGLIISGQSPDGKYVEMIEIADHPWFVGCQFHPEFKSSPMHPHPLFKNFIQAAIKHEKV